MTNKSLARQPFDFRNRDELRVIFNEYLMEEKEGEKLVWENLTTQNGLPHNWIYDIYQDSRLRLWVGTWGGGLGCLEEGHWRAITKKDGLHCNEVTCIREDAQGKIWVASDRGINVIEEENVLNGGLLGKSILNLTFDQKGHLWAGCWRAAYSGGGLFQLEEDNWKLYSTKQNLPGLEILKVFNDSHDRIWVGTYDQGIGAGIGCFDGRSWKNFTTLDGLADNCVYSMFEDPSGNMWFGTVGGISIFDGKNWHKLTQKDGLIDNRVYSMMIDSHKKMWFGTEEGVSSFDSKSWTSYKKKDGLVENLVRTMIESRDGSLWFGTYPYAKGLGGISKATYHSGKSLPDRIMEMLPEPKIQGLLPPKEVDNSEEEN